MLRLGLDLAAPRSMRRGDVIQQGWAVDAGVLGRGGQGR